MKIISGGQTGVDQAALIVARSLRLETGGWAPRGWRTTYGQQESLLRDLGLTECKEWGYGPRTDLNAAMSDLTIQVYEKAKSPGEIRTIKAVKAAGRKLYPFDLKSCLIEASHIQVFEDSVINFAGNSEETCPGIFIRSLPLIGDLLRILIATARRNGSAHTKDLMAESQRQPVVLPRHQLSLQDRSQSHLLAASVTE